MTHSFGTRRRLAALATGALGASALTMLPAVMAMSTAQAASADLSYNCTVETQTGTKVAKVNVDTDAPATGDVGTAFTPNVTLSMQFDAAFSNDLDFFRNIAGTATLSTVTGGVAGTAALTFANLVPTAGDGDQETLTATGSWGSVTPTAGGNLDLAVGNLNGSLNLTFPPVPPLGVVPAAIDCTPAEGQSLTVDTIAVTAPAPVPAGVANAYDCEYGTFGAFGATFYTVVSPPASATQGAAVSVPATSTLVWSDEWTAMSNRIAMEFRNGSAAMATTAGALGLTFGATPSTGDPMTWTASGTMPLDTASVGTKSIVPGAIALKVEAKNRFTGGEYSAADLTCTLVGTAAALGSVNVVAAPAPPAAPVAAATSTKVKTSYAKKAKKLTAAVTVSSSKGKPAGKVQLVLKKGAKKVGTVKVNVKNGKAKAAFKKIAKGKYKLTVKYLGNAAFKASSKTVTIKVKK